MASIDPNTFVAKEKNLEERRGGEGRVTIKKNSVSECPKLSNGIELPDIGLGLYLLEKGRETQDAVMLVLRQGHRLLTGYRFMTTREGWKFDDDSTQNRRRLGTHA